MQDVVRAQPARRLAQRQRVERAPDQRHAALGGELDQRELVGRRALEGPRLGARAAPRRRRARAAGVTAPSSAAAAAAGASSGAARRRRRRHRRLRRRQGSRCGTAHREERVRDRAAVRAAAVVAVGDGRRGRLLHGRPPPLVAAAAAARRRRSGWAEQRHGGGARRRRRLACARRSLATRTARRRGPAARAARATRRAARRGGGERLLQLAEGGVGEAREAEMQLAEAHLVARERPVLSVSRYSMPPRSSGMVDERTCRPGDPSALRMRLSEVI